LKPAVCAGH